MKVHSDRILGVVHIAALAGDCHVRTSHVCTEALITVHAAPTPESKARCLSPRATGRTPQLERLSSPRWSDTLSAL
eukprot:1805801-Rhodomonas_salina.1